ncbi:MAG: YeeE/YedE family protein [Dechloromonas sp.]|nr:YeeE/YedE family protein [Dechloromonas sp.]
MKSWCSLLAGSLFGSGLILAGMTNPRKVQAFLDIAGAWDPSLAFVMVGAILVAGLAFRLGRRRGIEFPQSAGSEIDTPLIVGSLVFGVGWGLAGICPGPALVGLGAGLLPASVFVICMLFGMEAQAWLAESTGRACESAQSPTAVKGPDRPEAS